MHRKIAAFISVCLLTSSAAAQELSDMPRMASTSLCGDSYVLALAEDNQIAALSWQSRGPLSLASEAQKALPQAWDEAERLIALSPDIVIFGPGEGYETQSVLEAAGIKILRLDWGEDEAALINNLAKFDRVFMPAGQREYPPNRPSILYLSRSGGSAGGGTYIDTLIKRIGGQNIWAEHGDRKGWFTPDAEQLAMVNPDFIITAYMSDGFESAQAKAVTGGVHRRLLKTTPSVEVPGKYLSCMSPAFYKAVEIARDGFDAWRDAQ
ncbi:ABC transporter substrate-binding protein [Robiginitomaculum antarcticum]|uniref:ABC transporter substrate-binding protein n=1 Tax=Robiginitomaculum antarcticum TaxID=437507 RepID=UPI000370B321|nr:ABC transporter substrate-binding protein [Robiginitomaculum antarcticum]